MTVPTRSRRRTAAPSSRRRGARRSARSQSRSMRTTSSPCCSSVSPPTDLRDRRRPPAHRVRVADERAAVVRIASEESRGGVGTPGRHDFVDVARTPRKIDSQVLCGRRVADVHVLRPLDHPAFCVAQRDAVLPSHDSEDTAADGCRTPVRCRRRSGAHRTTDRVARPRSHLRRPCVHPTSRAASPGLSFSDAPRGIESPYRDRARHPHGARRAERFQARPLARVLA